MQHQVFGQDRHDVCQAASAVEPFLGQQMGMTRTKEKDALFSAGCFSHSARDLQQYEAADKHLTQSMESLRDQSHRDQCVQWLTSVRAALGRPAPGITTG